MPIILTNGAGLHSEAKASLQNLGIKQVLVVGGTGAVSVASIQQIQALGIAPWLLIAAVPVIIVILAFNFLGDGLRDAADPYG